jgi:hypothetical protein
MRWLAASAVLVACGATPTTRATNAAAPAPSGEEAPPDLSNATLPNVCDGPQPTLTMVSGLGTYESGLGEGFEGEVEVMAVDRADLDGDVRYEWLALIVCRPGGSGTVDGVWAFHPEGGAWQLVGEIRGGDRADGGLDPSFRVEGTEVVVGRYSGSGEGLCCPTHVTEERWQLTGGTFQRTHVGEALPVHQDE